MSNTNTANPFAHSGLRIWLSTVFARLMKVVRRFFSDEPETPVERTIFEAVHETADESIIYLKRRAPV